jgi:hypothetical protein
MAAAASQRETSDPAVRRDLRTLTRFIEVTCEDRCGDVARAAVAIRPIDIPALVGREVRLCASCTRLLTHAVVKRTHCPMDPKPACKHCPDHCYHPKYRQQIREVMRYAGRKLVTRGRASDILSLLR